MWRSAELAVCLCGSTVETVYHGAAARALHQGNTAFACVLPLCGLSDLSCIALTVHPIHFRTFAFFLLLIRPSTAFSLPRCFHGGWESEGPEVPGVKGSKFFSADELPLLKGHSIMTSCAKEDIIGTNWSTLYSAREQSLLDLRSQQLHCKG